MSEKPKKKMGRPRVYANKDGRAGAPMLGFRFDPELYEYIHSQAQGPRQFLEELVRREMAAHDAEKKETE